MPKVSGFQSPAPSSGKWSGVDRPLQHQEAEHFDFFFENEADGVLIELHIERRALLEVFPHLGPISRVDAFDAGVWRSAIFGATVFILLRTVGAHRVNERAGNIIDESAESFTPEQLAGLAINLQNHRAGALGDVDLAGVLERLRAGRGGIDVEHAL